MTFFGLKWGQDLENSAAHPHQEFPGVPWRGGGGGGLELRHREHNYDPQPLHNNTLPAAGLGLEMVGSWGAFFFGLPTKNERA